KCRPSVLEPPGCGQRLTKSIQGSQSEFRQLRTQWAFLDNQLVGNLKQGPPDPSSVLWARSSHRGHYPRATPLFHVCPGGNSCLCLGAPPRSASLPGST